MRLAWSIYSEFKTSLVYIVSLGQSALHSVVKIYREVELKLILGNNFFIVKLYLSFASKLEIKAHKNTLKISEVG